ncbi:hypothetical protein [Streptomyces sp. SP18BB07]|uniref:hypothetical protein n=1 Tax=Streptomyces sp. SP18BB07 TaxID=3002522 RepID=UPI002E7A1E3A|nr:hypothetical protein [Streptomyces sp. SP18BB07]MEE1760392.1 hypothetical protein [Streptomyces sp. SP18BB07]
MAIPVPAAWSYTEAAAAVISLMTERNALSTAARLRPGTSRSGRDGLALRQLGLDELIATGEQDFADRVHEMTGGAEADVMVGTWLLRVEWCSHARPGGAGLGERPW